MNNIKLMKNIEKREVIIFLIIFILTCIIFLPLLTGHYASDSYNIYNIGYYDYAIKYSLKDGRIFMAILGLIAGKINISLENYIFITLFSALFISSISVMVLKNIIKKYKLPKNIFQEIITIVISYITVFNFMYLENMYFVESIVMAASVLLFIISANKIVEKNKNYLIKSLLLAIIGVMFYQGTIGLFFSFVFLFTILKNKNNIKQIVIDFIQSGIIAAIAVLVDLMLVKIVGETLEINKNRYGSLYNIPKNIGYIIKILPVIIVETCGLFPKNALFIFLNILTIIVIIYQLKKTKKTDNMLYKYLAIVIVVIASSVIINLTTLTSYNAGRLKNSLGALVGIIFVFLYVETNFLEYKEKIDKIAIFVLAIFTIINIFNYENIMLQHKKVNTLEQEEVKKLDEYISQYERETGIKVTKIKKVLINNSKNKEFFTEIKNKSIFAQNSMRLYWASDGVINFYTKRNLKTEKLTKEELEFYLGNRDEQTEYECIKDTIYVSSYVN